MPSCQVNGCCEPAAWVRVDTFPGCQACCDILSEGRSYTITAYLCQKHGRILEASQEVYSDLKRLAVIQVRK